MNRAIFDSRRPGGIYGIIDHSARPRDGVGQAKTLHRIDEDVLRTEVIAAGLSSTAARTSFATPMIFVIGTPHRGAARKNKHEKTPLSPV